MKLAKLKTAVLALGLGLGLSTSFTAVSSNNCLECEYRWLQCIKDGNPIDYCNRTIDCYLC